MTLSSSMFSADLAEIIADLPQTITVNGADYACVVDDEGITANVEVAGFAPDNSVKITVLSSTLSILSVGSLVVFSGRDYRVDEAQVSPDGVSWRAALVAED